ncbi:PWWP domain protein [Ceratobasidium sp. AG-Ba]|nr:PWWP domain protein [Ceratobasidium sp. AG-Ba]
MTPTPPLPILRPHCPMTTYDPEGPPPRQTKFRGHGSHKGCEPSTRSRIRWDIGVLPVTVLTPIGDDDNEYTTGVDEQGFGQAIDWGARGTLAHGPAHVGRKISAEDRDQVDHAPPSESFPTATTTESSPRMAQEKKDSEVKYEVGNVVIGKVKGYPPWPGEIIDPEVAPKRVKAERPNSKKVTFYCVRFFPAGDHSWLPTKDVSRLLAHEINAYINEPSKKKGELLEGYKIAKDPTAWRKEKDDLAKREREREESGQGPDSAADEHDELGEDEEDSSDSGKKSKAKKRKRESTAKESAEEKKGKRKRASEQLVKQRRGKGKKSAEHIESEDEDEKPATDKPTSSKADKERPSKRVKKESIAPTPAAAGGGDDDGDDAAMAADPEAAKVKEWRHKLQRAFLTKTAPAPEEMAGLDAVFTTVEQYDKMTVEYLSYSKIGKVMRKIIQLPNIPSDEQYHFRQRASSLVTKWQQLITTSEGDNGSKAPTSSKAAKPKSKSSQNAGTEGETNGAPNGAAPAEGDAMEVDKGAAA